MHQKNKLGLIMLTTLVAGNMIGSGIFLLPSDLAHIGSISLLSWIFTAFGAFLLATVFSKMSHLVPKTGGPYAYAYAGFGRFIGFQTAYNYWIAMWIGNAAIVIAMIGYLRVFWPELSQPIINCIFGISMIWILTIVNIVGVRAAGFLQVVTTFCKLIPILLIAILGWWHFHPDYLINSFNLSHTSNFTAVSHGATLTLWAFIGLESATIPSGSVENPTRNIPLATFLGTIIAAIVYIASSTTIMGMIPAKILAASTSPFAAAAGVIFGKWGNWIIAAGAAISCFGALNGWILLQGQIPMAAADDKLFPKIFAKRNKSNVPAWGLVISSLLISILLILTVSPNLVKQFQVIILMASIVTLIPYLYTSIAAIILQLNNGMQKHVIASIIIALLAGLYSFWAIFGSGIKTIYYASLLIFSSIPLYALVCWYQDHASKEENFEQSTD